MDDFSTHNLKNMTSSASLLSALKPDGAVTVTSTAVHVTSSVVKGTADVVTGSSGDEKKKKSDDD